MTIRASVVLLLGLAGCAASPRRHRDHPPSQSGLSASYVAALDDRGTIVVSFDANDPSFSELTIEDDAGKYVSDVEVGPRGGPFEKVDLAKWPLSLPACERACSVRYRFDLRGAAQAFDDGSYAARFGEAYLAPASTWLARPLRVGAGGFDLAVRVPKGWTFVSGLQRDAAGAFHARMDDLPQSPYAAFGSFAVHDIDVDRRKIELVRVGPQPKNGDAALQKWVARSADDIAKYYGAFPPERAIVIAIVGEGRAVSEGTALGNGGASILVHVGVDVTDDTLANDWILTHEMVHLSMPGLASRHRWLEEGLATYLEPVARARVGRLKVEEVWDEWLKSMQKGQPAKEDGGMDGTESWGRIYWGGAAFWLLAEVGIAEATEGKKSLQDCLRAVVADGGTIASRWTVQRFLQSCDRGVGQPVAEKLYESLANRRVEFELDSVFKRLGVRKAAAGLVFDDTAPEARLRRSLLSPISSDKL